MKRIFLYALGSVCVLLFSSAALEAGNLRVLIVDGQNNHDWRETTRATRATLLAAGRFDVDVTTTPKKKASLTDWAAWRPEFSDYDVIVSNYNGELWPQEVRRDFMAYVEAGGGVVMVHAANNPFRDWPEFNQMIGLGWRSAELGRRVTIDDGTGEVRFEGPGEGRGAGHGKQHPYVVKVRRPDHPIMKGLPVAWLHGKDELYHGQRGPAENMTVLSSAFSAEDTRGTGAHEPITWVIPYGRGRVVTTVLGHHWPGQEDFDALHCVGFQTILVRSTEWAATQEVTLPIPQGFPTANAVSIVEPDKVSWTAAKSAEAAPRFTAGSCCDKAAKAGGACGHGCCKKARASGTVCVACNPR